MTIELTDFFLIFIVLAFGWVALDYLIGRFSGRVSRWRARRKYRECHICENRYPERPGQKLSTCPDCETLNLKKGHRRLG